MWDQLLSNPATRAYLLRFPPSTWEEKTVEAIQSALQTDKQRNPHFGHTTKPTRSLSHTHKRDSSTQRRPATRLAHSHKSVHSSSSSRRGSTRSVTSSPSLPAQPISLVTAAAGLPPRLYPLVQPLTPNNPLLTGHARPVTYADEYYYTTNPYATTAADIGSHQQERDWPHRVGRNERNYSSATLLHHHEYPPPTRTAAVAERPINTQHFAWPDGRAAEVVSTVDEAVQTSSLPTLLPRTYAVADEADVASDSSEYAGAVSMDEAQSTRRRYVQQRKGNDIVINVQYQQPQHSQTHNSPPLPTPVHLHTQHQPTYPARQQYAAPSSIASTQTAVDLQPANSSAAMEALHSPSLFTVKPATAAAVPIPASTPFYSSAQPSRPLLHPSYSHPHSVYPAWWPSEDDRIAQERVEDAQRREEERRRRKREAVQRQENARVRPIAAHQCPPPPPQAREGVAERKEDRQREWSRAEREKSGDELMLRSTGEDVNVLAAHPAWSHSSASSSFSSTTAAAGVRGGMQSLSYAAPPRAVQSRIKPLLDRDRSRHGALYDNWGATPALNQSNSAQRDSTGPSLTAAGASSTPITTGSYASLIRSLAADPIVSSFASHPNLRPLSPSQTPLSHSTSSSTASTSTTTASFSSSRAALLAAAASVSTAAAAAALDELENANRDTDEDRAAARREWETIAATQAAKPFARQRSAQWGVEDVSDDSESPERVASLRDEFV